MSNKNVHNQKGQHMRFKKTVPYKLIPMLAMAAMPIFTSCNSDDDDTPPQQKILN